MSSAGENGRKVLKFGGSSLSSAENVMRCVKIVKESCKAEDIIIVSAKGVSPSGTGAKTTDCLIALAGRVKTGRNALGLLAEICEDHESLVSELGLDRKEIDPEVARLKDLVISSEKWSGLFTINEAAFIDAFSSFGGRFMARIFAAKLLAEGVKSRAFDAGDLILTDSNFGSARPLDGINRQIRDILRGNEVAVVPGFYGKAQNGLTTTLGRGGSDYTAAILANAVSASGLWMYSDVEGIKFANPKVVPCAKTIGQMSYAEAQELSFYGAKLHPHTIAPAMAAGIPVYVLSTFNPDGPFTVITKVRERTNEIVKGISSQPVQIVIIETPAMLNLPGFLQSVFTVFGKAKISIGMTFHRESGVALSIDKDADISSILPNLEEFGRVRTIKDRTKLCVVGEGMQHTKGVLATLAAIMARAGVNIEDVNQDPNEINVTFVIDDKDVSKALNALATANLEAVRDFILRAEFPASTIPTTSS